MALSVLSYNIHKGFKSGGLTPIHNSLREALHRRDPDLLFLQEVVGQNDQYKSRHVGWPEASQHEFLKSESLIHAHYGKNVVYPHGHHGNALLSKNPILHESNIDISVYKFEPRGCLYTKIQPPGTAQILHAFCAHLGLTEHQRKIQVLKICDFIQHRIAPGEPVILAGDFNDWWQNASAVIAERLGMKEAFLEFYGSHARSFPSWLPLSCVDRIYYRDLKLVSCERLTGKPWTQLSDHLPLTATFQFF